MSVTRIDHLNVTSSEGLIERCRAFYIEVLGLTEGPRPPFRSRGYWLYAGEAPIVHLTIAADERVATNAAPLDHVALACNGLDETLARLEQHAIAHEIDRVPGSDVAQIFLHDPAGVALELNFGK
ncbi:MAG: diguanylate cyclase [Acidobacteria bacterium]|nr:diguanylate cyclase [Acidobacteriota bacterium]